MSYPTKDFITSIKPLSTFPLSFPFYLVKRFPEVIVAGIVVCVTFQVPL